MTNRHRWKTIASWTRLVLCVAACACKSEADDPGPPPPPRPQEPPLLDPKPECPPQGCGSNSPIFSGSRYMESLSLDGERNEDGIRYVRGSFRCRTGAASSDLTVQNGAITGCSLTAIATGEPAATFEVEDAGALGPRETIGITVSQKVATWHVDPTKREDLTSYRFTRRESTGAGGPVRWRPLCPAARPWMDPWQTDNLPPAPMGPTAPTGTTVPGTPPAPAVDPRVAVWQRPTFDALIVQGESYDRRGDIRKTGTQWLNIACAGAAFSKMRLLGFNPFTDGQGPVDRGRRTATLKMITARYFDGVSHTVQGTPLLWVSNPKVEYHGMPAPPRVGPLEATWGPRGVHCVAHSRLWNEGFEPLSNPDVRAVIHRAARPLPSPGAMEDTFLRGVAIGRWPRLPFGTPLLKRLQQVGCAPGAEDASENVWTTYTVDHVAH